VHFHEGLVQALEPGLRAGTQSVPRPSWKKSCRFYLYWERSVYHTLASNKGETSYFLTVYFYFRALSWPGCFISLWPNLMIFSNILSEISLLVVPWLSASKITKCIFKNLY